MREVLSSAILFLTVTIIAASCAFEKKGQSPSLSGEIPSWIEGQWFEESENRLYSEVWEKINDTVLTGFSSMTGEGDTLYTEKLLIVRKADGWHYIAAVSNQNGGGSIDFPLIKGEDKLLLFENPHHDYPQRIEYLFLSADSLKVTIGAILPADKRESSFILTRARK